MLEENVLAEKTGGRPRWRRRIVAIVLVTLAALAFGAVGPRVGSTIARAIAGRRLLGGEIGAAQWWLAWSQWLDRRDYRADLLEASCHRLLGQRKKWEECLRQANRKGDPEPLQELERELDHIRLGGPLKQDLEATATTVAAKCDLATAVFQGCLAQRAWGGQEVAGDSVAGRPGRSTAGLSLGSLLAEPGQARGGREGFPARVGREARP